MDVNIFLEEKDFNDFLVWMNRLEQGVIFPCPVKYYNTPNNLKNSLQLTLDADEYAMLKDAETDINDLMERLGISDIKFKPEPYDSDKLLISGIIKNAERWDLSIDVIMAAIEVAQKIKDITPLEAMIIAERDITEGPNKNF